MAGGLQMTHAYRDFVVEYGGWLLFAGLVLILGVFMVYQRRGARLRLMRIQRRESVGEDQWFEALYPVAPDNRGPVRDILLALATDIGVEWTKLRPTDTFEEVLRVNPRYAPHEDLEGAEYRIVSYAQMLGIADKGLPGFTGALKEFLDRWVILCGGEPPLVEAS